MIDLKKGMVFRQARGALYAKSFFVYEGKTEGRAYGTQVCFEPMLVCWMTERKTVKVSLLNDVRFFQYIGRIKLGAFFGEEIEKMIGSRERNDGELTSWERPLGATPKSPKFICKSCGELAYYISRKNPMICRYRYCPNCGRRVADDRT